MATKTCKWSRPRGFLKIAGRPDALSYVAPASGARMTGWGACVIAAFDPEDAAQHGLSLMPRVTESTG